MAQQSCHYHYITVVKGGDAEETTGKAVTTRKLTGNNKGLLKASNLLPQ